MDLKHIFGVPLQYKTKKLTSPNLIIPLNYNLFILLVDYAYMVCATTFIVKISKYRGTSVY